MLLSYVVCHLASVAIRPRPHKIQATLLHCLYKLQGGNYHHGTGSSHNTKLKHFESMPANLKMFHHPHLMVPMGWVERARMVLNKLLHFPPKMRNKCEVYCHSSSTMMTALLNFNEKKNSKNHADLTTLLAPAIDCKQQQHYNTDEVLCPFPYYAPTGGKIYTCTCKYTLVFGGVGGQRSMEKSHEDQATIKTKSWVYDCWWSDLKPLLNLWPADTEFGTMSAGI